ncbi:MAG: bacterial Ig-like domain-containing protein [Oscillospiraceae bacterium]|nr:bacterial Ig-like domain-containing protein [Oscillospiraceae bacterium]
MKKHITAIAAALTLLIIPISAAAENKTTTVAYKYGENVFTRQMEKLDRGLIAVNTNGGVYVGWRMTGDEGNIGEIRKSPDFDVYRNGEKIATVSDSTNYFDPSGKNSDVYSVAIVGTENPCGEVKVKTSNYLDIKMNKPENFVVGEISYGYTVGDCSAGDLDGDGEYELVVKWDCNPQDNSNGGITGNVLLDAYKLDGTMLWRIDLGRNIRSGAHYTQFLVYDFNMDGKAEVTCKTAPGSIDGKGEFVSAASSTEAIKAVDDTVSYVNDYGYVLDGDEFFTAFDGETGAALDTIYYPVQRINAGVWGDSYGNRCDRFLAAVAVLDGERPYAVYWRGYYGGQSGYGQRTGICALSLDDNGKLDCKYCFDTYDVSKTRNYKGVNGYTKGNENYTGQGNHNLTVADVDNDGKDEVISGAMCMEINDNDKLMPRWCTFMGHGDALHIGDYDPTHAGFEFYTVHEESGCGYGQSVIDADTGEIIWHVNGTADTGRGIMANVGAGGYYQVNSSRAGAYTAVGGGVFTPANIGSSMNFRIFWDKDLYDELLDSTTIASWNGSKMSNIFSANGCVSINGTKATPALQADLFGDWREEVCYPLSNNSAVRIFTTTEITNYKLPTLMHDPVYRSGVAAEQTAYNQPPHIGFYLSEDIFKAPLIGIEITPPLKTEYNIDDRLDLTGITVKKLYDDETYEYTDDYSVTGYDGTRAGEQIISVVCGGFTEKFTIKVNTGFVCDEKGYITGYTSDNETARIPTEINGIEIIGIAAGALDNSPIKALYVYDNIEDIEANDFSGIKIYCYAESGMHIYAEEHGLKYETLDSSDYIVNLDFSESEYSELGIFQSGASQEITKGAIIYGVGGRNSGGDGASGFSVIYNKEDAYLKCGVGQFATSGRNGYMKFVGVPAPSLEYDTVFSFDFMIPYAYNYNKQSEMHPYILIEDANENEIDSVSAENLGIEKNEWYGYSLIYHNGGYYRALKDASGTLLSVESLETKADSIFALKFLQLGGDFGQGGNTYIAIDNLKLYTNACALSNLYVNVKTEDGAAVANAEVKIDNLSSKTGADAAAKFILPTGLYTAKISSAGYENASINISAYRREITKTATVSKEDYIKVYTDYDASSGKLTLNAKDESVTSALVAAVTYDEDNIMTNAEIYSVEFTDGVAVLDDMEITEGVKIFVWDSISGMKPLAEKFTV